MGQNTFLNKKWLADHLKAIKQKAGPRYTPKLNVILPIAEIFDGISRTENFYVSIRKHYGKLNREFRRVPSNYEDKEIQKKYKDLRNKVSLLSELLDELKEYNT